MDMIEVLRATPELTELVLKGDSPSCMSDFFLSRLTRVRDAYDADLVPKLRVFAFEASSHQNINMLALADAVRSRISEDTDDRLESLILGWVDGREIPNSVAIAHLWKLKDLGLDVRVLRKGFDLAVWW